MISPGACTGTKLCMDACTIWYPLYVQLFKSIVSWSLTFQGTHSHSNRSTLRWLHLKGHCVLLEYSYQIKALSFPQNWYFMRPCSTMAYRIYKKPPFFSMWKTKKSVLPLIVVQWVNHQFWLGVKRGFKFKSTVIQTFFNYKLLR